MELQRVFWLNLKHIDYATFLHIVIWGAGPLDGDVCSATAVPSGSSGASTSTRPATVYVCFGLRRVRKANKPATCDFQINTCSQGDNYVLKVHCTLSHEL